mmetsp:Transcript_34914/g.110287  ORF Transcript_34914/g.110287 Transcript_34914/m.110287 type:complete len:304 (+) Transcript_34914:355-1266(+)
MPNAPAGARVPAPRAAGPRPRAAPLTARLMLQPQRGKVRARKRARRLGTCGRWGGGAGASRQARRGRGRGWLVGRGGTDDDLEAAVLQGPREGLEQARLVLRSARSVPRVLHPGLAPPRAAAAASSSSACGAEVEALPPAPTMASAVTTGMESMTGISRPSIVTAPAAVCPERCRKLDCVDRASFSRARTAATIFAQKAASTSTEVATKASWDFTLPVAPTPGALMTTRLSAPSLSRRPASRSIVFRSGRAAGLPLAAASLACIPIAASARVRNPCCAMWPRMNARRLCARPVVWASSAGPGA